VTREELELQLKEKKERVEEINFEFSGMRFTDEVRAEWNELNGDIDDLEETIREVAAREDRIRRFAEDESKVEKIEMPQVTRSGVVKGEDIYDMSTVRRSWDDPGVEGKELHERALRAIDQAVFPRNVDAKGHVEELIARIDNEAGQFSRYLLATGSLEYKRAFTKALAGQRTSPREDDLLYRAASLTAASGGYAVPFVLDPTVLPTSNGAINPYRSIASVQQITVDEWRGVTSTGITAAFQAEASAVTDNSPTLAQPIVSTEMARAFVPFSIEIGQDWASFSTEMASMLQDAKDVLEATKFAVGSGTNEPFGVVTGATTVFTASATNSLFVADVYGVHNALGPRFRGNATWVMNNAVADRIRQLDTAGGAQLWVDNLRLRSAAVPNSMTDGRMGADLLGKPTYESTSQSGTFTTGQLIAVIGDWRYYKIVDRVGLTIETIPHLFGPAQGNLPTGQRGLFAFWRVGAKVLDANAFRTLKLA
jgi:HK97 family phage major capsid protein